MSELKACPLCGSKIVRMNGSYADTCFCINTLCPLSNPMKVDKCQSRPLEDALQAKLDETRDYFKHIKYAQEQMLPSWKLMKMVNGICNKALAKLEDK